MAKIIPKGKVKRQHTVPATYLRKFCTNHNGKKTLYALNKISKEIINCSPEKIGKINEFYETIKEEQVLEKTFSVFETKYNELFDEIIKGVDLISNETRNIFSRYMALQFLRTESMKKSWGDISRTLLETEKKIVPKLKKEIEDSLKPENIREMNKSFILENFERFAEIIFNRKWILIRNKTRREFWTSDNPLTPYNMLKDGGIGLKSHGCEFYFPLSPKYCLIVYDPNLGKYLPSEMEADQSNVTFQRDLQTNFSTRFVFSIKKEFALALSRMKETPETANPKRPTLKIVNGRL